jgi:hypothetical protein
MAGAVVCATRHGDAPATLPTIRAAVRAIAHPGGFLGRTKDGEPGVMVIGKGWQRLVAFVHMYRMLRPHPRS